MYLSGIRPGAGFYDYDIKNSDMALKKQPAEAAASQVEAGQEDNVSELASQEIQETGADHGAEEFAGRYQPDTLYQRREAMSDIASLDVEQAISDMKRDQILQQYQFFVGESRAEELLAAEREQENFFL